MPESIKEQYERRLPLLAALCKSLLQETEDALEGVAHIDRITFRVKSLDSFLKKVEDPANDPSYEHPLTEIEDQVAGRVIVFFLFDIETIQERLAGTYTTVERSHRRPKRDEEFGYESHHLICTIPPHVLPDSWMKLDDPPTTFEIRVRTVFMHAYSEPQHHFAYKSSTELPPNVKKELAWIAASAWGADQAYARVAGWARELDETADDRTSA
jgi:ppGpp synthetase/RelA/SpoT-type nucleotidyltranferase